jgi:hypothetical protein
VDTGTGVLSQAEEAGDDLVVGVLSERVDRCQAKLLGVAAFGGQGSEQGSRLDA